MYSSLWQSVTFQASPGAVPLINPSRSCIQTFISTHTTQSSSLDRHGDQQINLICINANIPLCVMGAPTMGRQAMGNPGKKTASFIGFQTIITDAGIFLILRFNSIKCFICAFNQIEIRSLFKKKKLRQSYNLKEWGPRQLLIIFLLSANMTHIRSEVGGSLLGH